MAECREALIALTSWLVVVAQIKQEHEIPLPPLQKQLMKEPDDNFEDYLELVIIFG